MEELGPFRSISHYHSRPVCLRRTFMEIISSYTYNGLVSDPLVLLSFRCKETSLDSVYQLNRVNTRRTVSVKSGCLSRAIGTFFHMASFTIAFGHVLVVPDSRGRLYF